jgi:ubiquinone/menaquinone biosynthesis C-methylase UbiE
VLRVAAAPEAIKSPTRPDDFPLPPAALRAGYSVNDDERYLASGAMDVAAIRSMIERHAPGFAPTRVLVWGCSTGRLIRHWLDVANAGGEVWGVDLCATAVNWATENLSPPFRFVQGTSRPRLPFPDASLDFVYANSVFTHIRELWDTWLMELRRVIRPGGLLFVTILDEKCWEWIGRSKGNLIAKACDGIDFTLPLDDDFVAHGSGGDVVSFWHTRGVRRRWSFAFDILAMEYGTVYNQTGVLLRRP